jgi:hypothetical protein
MLLISSRESQKDLIRKIRDNFSELAEAVARCASKPVQVSPLVLSSEDWHEVSGIYEYELEVANITAENIVDVIPDNGDAEIVQAAGIYPKTESSAGTVTLYSKNAPTDDITVTINIF